MDGSDASRRHHVTASVTSGHTAPAGDLHAWEHGATSPVLLSLTEEERRHGLELFAAEEARASEEAQTFERVPAHVATIVPIDRTFRHAIPPAPPDARSALTWQSPLLAAVLAAVVVVFGLMSVRSMRTATDGRLPTLNDRTAEPSDAAHDVPVTAAVVARPSSATTLPAAGEPASLNSPKSRDISASEKMRERLVGGESASLRAPARSTPPISAEREVPRNPPDPPIHSASASSPGTAEPLPILESTIAPLLGGPTLPASLSVDPRPVVVVPATLPRADASGAPVPRLPSPETAIHTVLSQYRAAYRDLDAGAARVVWPSVDTKALRKAFDRLERQDLSFNSCQIAVSDVRAVASCDGFASYVPRVGNKGPHDDQRQWEFKLSKVDDMWLIDTVSAR